MATGALSALFAEPGSSFSSAFAGSTSTRGERLFFRVGGSRLFWSVIASQPAEGGAKRTSSGVPLTRGFLKVQFRVHLIGDLRHSDRVSPSLRCPPSLRLTSTPFNTGWILVLVPIHRRGNSAFDPAYRRRKHFIVQTHPPPCTLPSEPRPPHL